MKISAIVPVYNTEKLVGRCIESVLAQSFPDWELILVDDGSRDGSLNVLREYEKKDTRLKVIHQENAGPGIARNRGIKEATGDYIVFIDSDDVIKPEYFEKLSKETAEVVFIDINQVDENFHVLREEHMSDYQSLSKDDLIRSQMTGKILWGGVRKAVKRDLLQKNGIEFTEHKVGEEAIYSFLLLHYANSCSFIKGCVYEYVNRTGSQSDTKDEDPWGPVAIALKNRIVDLNLYNNYASTINAFLLASTVVSLDRISRSNDYHRYLIKAKRRIKEFKTEIDRECGIDYSSLNNKVLFSYPLVKLCVPSIFYCISRIRALVRK